MLKKTFSCIPGLLMLVSLVVTSPAMANPLLNNPVGYPYITYNSTGLTAYDHDSGLLSVFQALPQYIYITASQRTRITSGTLSVQVQIDNTGALAGGVAGDDFVLTGTVDIGSGPISGVLLRGEIQAYGFFNSTTSTDTFDFRFVLTPGGLLDHLFPDSDICMVTYSEGSSFNGAFDVDFGGGAKGNIFPVPLTDELASLGDFVWNDLDADGIQDAGEPGVGGVTVNLFDCNDIFIKATTTASDGSYLFDGLPTGDYYVVFELPAGYLFSPRDNAATADALDSDADTATGETVCTTLDPGETDTTWDAGIYELASLGDFVWKDLDADGIQDAGEPGIGGVTVNLYDCSDNLKAATTTASDGSYLFNDLIPGEYYVAFELPAGYLFSLRDNAATTDALDSDPDTMTGKTVCTTLVSGENDLSWDAGLYEPASLGDYVWLDMNKDGIQNDGDTGISGVTVNLFKCGETGTVFKTQQTDTTGYYLFDNLEPGCYVVAFVKPGGYEFTPQDAGADDTLDSDASPSGYTQQTILESGENDLTWDAGLVMVTTAEIGDYVWDDHNADGIQNNGDTGIEGVIVHLYNCNDPSFEKTTTTDENGFYLFKDLMAGDYKVVFDQPPGYLPSPQDAGTDFADSDADPVTGATICTTLEIDESDRTWDAGFYKPAALGDRVWLDTDSDGIQDPDEAGIMGVIVNLYDCNDLFITSTTTDPDGLYLFNDLPPGDYYVVFELPAGYLFSPLDNQGTTDDLDSDADTGTGKTTCTTLVSGENDITWDAGLVALPCSLTVQKYCSVPVPPPISDFECVKPIDALTMIWNGSGTVWIKAYKGPVGSELLLTSGDLAPGQAVTVTGYAGSPNDVFWEIFQSGTVVKLGESKFHLSCSDGEMDGPEDCGKPEGDGKENTSSLINDWILAGMVDSKSSFDCFPQDPGPGSENCEITVPAQIECDGDLKQLGFKYLGGNCDDTNNWQAGKFTCSGDADLNQPVRILITKDADKLTVFPNDESIMIGDKFTITANDKLASDTMFDIMQGSQVLQSLKIHTSCSQPLSLGDRFGSVLVITMDQKDGDYLSSGAEVAYTYVIGNSGASPVLDVTVMDSVFGEIPGSPIASIAPGDQVTLYGSAFIEETTTNSVMVAGETKLGGVCSATDSSTVTVVVPQPECIASGDSTLKVSDNKFEWKLYNTGADPITIERLSLGWPAELGKIKSVFLDGDKIFDPDDAERPMPPSALIDTWTADVSKRQIDAGKTGILKIEFVNKADTLYKQYSILVNFLEGCSVEYVPGELPWQCTKPIDVLTMIWNGTQNIRIKAYKGAVGSTQLADIDNIAPGDTVTVSGFAGSPNDVYWEIFKAGSTNKLGESTFHLSCSDDDMNGPEDCGKAEGDGKDDKSEFINLWLLKGMVDSTSSFVCP